MEPSPDIVRWLIPATCPECGAAIRLLPWVLTAEQHARGDVPGVRCPVSLQVVEFMLVPIRGA